MADPELTREVRATWERVAPVWEQHRARVFEGFRPASDWLVEHVSPRPGQTILELTAGPGETGFLVAERVGHRGRMISTDIAPGMVEAVRRGAAERGLANVEARVMDAQAIDLDDDSVDGVISRLGFMLVPDPGTAFREVRRVLRDGGRFAYAVIGSPAGNPWVGLIVMAMVQRGHSPTGDPFGPGGPFSLADHDRNRALLAEAGFDDIEVSDLTGTMRYESPGEYWDVQSRIGGSIPALLAALPASEVAEIRTAVNAMAEQYATADGVGLPSSLVVVSAR